ncbi:dienelactone hydrolase family protein [Corynebacterium breve]|uniref:Dienelactone hydrolase family protein n=1 Tax=Corynebacterium breve TaxID=3049799 RepID=A0ABY8VH59_9CORY|nr:dienelactone hydrolase family protein [Corynebacterium breve]WIM68985.1 dienelactone hydrolase family protein [Corynebacterium breve]
MSANLKKSLKELSKRGPHHVLEGDLGYTGLPGKIYTPEKGNGLPAIAFGHDWTKPIKHYHATLRHLASWGIVVAAPDTEIGFNPDHAGFAADLESALQIVAGVKLGNGNVSVSPKKLGVVGHGMGGGAAVLTAADNPKVGAVAAIYPANTSPSAAAAARTIEAPALVIGSGKSELFDAGNPAKLAYNWKGDVAYREIENGNQQSFAEDAGFQFILGAGLPKTAARETAWGLVTGFLLHQLDNEGKYSDFSDPEATGPKVSSYAGLELADKAGFAKDDTRLF